MLHRCPHCGEDLPAVGDAYCIDCGGSLTEPPEPAHPPARTPGRAAAAESQPATGVQTRAPRRVLAAACEFVLYVTSAVGLALQVADLLMGEPSKRPSHEMKPLQDFHHTAPTGDSEERTRLSNAIVGRWVQQGRTLTKTVTFSAKGFFDARGVYDSNISGTWAVIDPNTVEVIQGHPLQRSVSRYTLKVSVHGDVLKFIDESPHAGTLCGPPVGEYFREK